MNYSYYILFLLSVILVSCAKDGNEKYKPKDAIEEELLAPALDSNLNCQGLSSSSYFPLSIGALWIYNNGSALEIDSFSDKDSSIYFYSTITRDYRTSDETSYKSYFRIDSKGNIYKPRGDISSATNENLVFIPIDSIGQEWNEYRFTGTKWRVESVNDTVIIADCIYYNCIHLYGVKKYPAGQHFNAWYSPGYGKVKFNTHSDQPELLLSGQPFTRAELIELYE